jgi:hypothetical protein
MPRPDETEYKKLTWLLSRLSKAEDFCQPYFLRAKRHYRLYRFGSAVDDADWPYVNRTRTRDILAFIEDSTATMMQSLLGTYPFYSVVPRQTSLMELRYTGLDPIKIGQQIETCLNYQIAHEETEFFEEMSDYFRNAGIYGTSYVGVFPKFDDKNNYIRPLIKVIDFWNVMPIVGARRITKAFGVFYREFMTREEAVDMARRGNIVDSQKKLESFLSGSGSENNWHQGLLSEVGVQNYEPNNDNIELVHYMSGGHIITTANRAVVLRDSNKGVQGPAGLQVVKPFPYDQPIVQYKYMPVPLEFFGMGIPEVLEVLQEDKNLIRSARRDNIDLVINKVIKAKAGADVNYDLLKYYSGAIWPLENLGDIEVLEQGDVTQSAYMEEEKVRFDMENALSMFGYARGMTPTHEERPTTVIKLQQAAMNRLDLAIKMAEFTVLENIATRIIMLTRRYMKPEVYQSIVGEPDAGLFKMSEEDVRQFFRFKPMGSTVTHIKEIRQQQMQFALTYLQSVAPISQMNINPFTIDWLELSRNALEDVDIKNIDKVLIPLRPELLQPTANPGMGPVDVNQLSQVSYGGQDAGPGTV